MGLAHRGGTWRIRGTPNWDAKDLLQWLSDCGWEGVEVVSAASGRRGWLVRGRPDRPGEAWCYNLQGGTGGYRAAVEVTKMAKSAQRLKEKPAARRSTSWVLPRTPDDDGTAEPSAPAATESHPMETEELRPAPATPYTAMNRLVWIAEQIEARRKLEEAGQLEAWGDISEDA
eukprot:5903612-Alexandrium_andersonii.AAC.1